MNGRERISSEGGPLAACFFTSGMQCSMNDAWTAKSIVIFHGLAY